MNPLTTLRELSIREPGAVIAVTPAVHVQVIRADGRSDEWYVALDGVYALSFSGPDAYDRAELCREELELILVEPLRSTPSANGELIRT